MMLAELEEDFKQLDTVQLEERHTFAENMYIRELHIPKGVMLIGKRHRHKTMNMLVKGKMTIYDEHNTFDIEAPFYAESEAMTKKAGYAHEDSVFLNIHITNETDLDKLEKEFIITEEEFLAISGGKECLG